MIITLISVPVIIISAPSYYFRRIKFLKRYAHFLEQNNGQNYFCYNNKKNLKEFIELEIIPELDEKISIIYLNGKHVETDTSSKEFISNALYNLRNYSKFPHLMKIRNGKIIDSSVNALAYGVKNQKKSKEHFIAKIDDFFDFKN